MNKVLSREDEFGVALLCMADTICQTLEQRTQPKSRRWNKIQKMKEALLEIDATYQGSIDDEFREYAEKFYNEMEASLTRLLQLRVKGVPNDDGKVQPAEEDPLRCAA